MAAKSKIPNNGQPKNVVQAKPFTKAQGRANIKDKLLSSDPTRDYHSTRFNYFGELFVQNLPLWRLWTGRMMLTSDPIVDFALQVRNAALGPAQVLVEGPNTRVCQWVQQQWDYLWSQHRGKLLSAKEYGFAGVQAVFKNNTTTGLVDIDGLKDFAPEDLRALEQDNRIVGMRVKGNPVYFPQACWLTFNGKYGSPYGTGCLRKMYPPWYEKWMDHGAKRLLQLRMIKDAYIGDIFWYPPNILVELPDGTKMGWRDLMREMGENRLSGGALSMPSFFDEKGNKLTDYTPPQDIAGASHIFEWVDHCDENILRGADIPLEVVKAADTGSGYSGRSIPFLVVLSTCTKELVEIVQQIDDHLIRPLAWLNFGGDPDYQLLPQSLVESFSQDTAGSPMGGAAVGGQPGQAPPQEQGPPQQYAEDKGVYEHLHEAVGHHGPVLAESHQNGYTLRIHAHPHEAHEPGDFREHDGVEFRKRGQMTIQHPKGHIVRTGYWMDTAEHHYPKNYKKLPREHRAHLEAQEQLKWGHEHNYHYHHAMNTGGDWHKADREHPSPVSRHEEQYRHFVDAKGQHNIHVHDSNGNKIASGQFVDKGDHIKVAPGSVVYVDPQHRRKGIATGIYNHAAKVTGKPVKKSAVTTGDGSAFEAKYFGSQHEEQPTVDSVNFHGLPIAIECKAGHARKEGQQPLANDYGSIQRTKAADGDQVDVFLGPQLKSELVFVFDQPKVDGGFDEHKVMLGFISSEEAEAALRSNYPAGWKIGDCTPLTVSQFKAWLQEGDTGKPVEEQVSAFSEAAHLHQTGKLTGEEGYHYHATNQDNLHDIASEGHLNTHRPWHGTEQSSWPDGSKERRSYWHHNPETTKSFAPEHGKPVLVRTKNHPHMKRESTGDSYTTKKIPSHQLEYLGHSGTWHPVAGLSQHGEEEAPCAPFLEQFSAQDATHNDRANQFKIGHKVTMAGEHYTIEDYHDKWSDAKSKHPDATAILPPHIEEGKLGRTWIMRHHNSGGKYAFGSKAVALYASHQSQHEELQFEESEAVKRLREFIQRGTSPEIRTAVQRIRELKQGALGTIELADVIEREVKSLQPALERELAKGMFIARIEGAAEAAEIIPAKSVIRTPPDSPEPPRDSPTHAERARKALAAQGVVKDATVRLPALEHALQRLDKAPVAATLDYRLTAEKVRQGAFAVTADLTDKAVTDVKDVLARNLAEGGTRDEFIEEVTARLDGTGAGPLSPSHLETIYRTNVMAQLSDGKAQLLADPMVADAFPYVAYHATRDGRVRKDHMALESLGLQGTNIYRFDDPVFKMFRPPWDYQCRCSFTPQTVEQAARKGVTEAREWLERAKAMALKDGGSFHQYLNKTAPVQPAHVTAPKFRPSPEFTRLS